MYADFLNKALLCSLSWFVLGLGGGILAPNLALARAYIPEASDARIVAVVNQEAISSLELHRRIGLLKQQMAQTGKAIINEAELNQAVLERLVYETLMLQLAKKQHLIPSDAVVSQAIADNAAQSGLDVAEFLARLEQAGTPIAQYKDEVKQDLALVAVREKALAARIKIADADVEQFLNDPQSGITIEYAAWVLWLPKPETASPVELLALKQNAQALYQAALKANTLKEFAALQPTLPFGSKHVVDLGAKPLEKLPELFSKPLETMAIGATSSVLESSAGFYVVRLHHKHTALPKVPQTLARHILLMVSETETDADVRKKIAALHNQLVLNPTLFADLAKANSQDGSASKGGELGWVLPGDLVPEFENVMDSLKPGEIALPLRSPFGWHIVQVLDRKTAEMPLPRLRNQARNILRTQKQKQAMGEWLEQLKAQSYIEYR